MTLSSLTCFAFYASGSADPMTLPFRIMAEEDLEVVKISTTTGSIIYVGGGFWHNRIVGHWVEEVLTLGDDYTVDGVLSATCSITLLDPDADSNYIIRRAPPLLQELSLRNQGSYPAASIEDQLDYLTEINQTLYSYIASIVAYINDHHDAEPDIFAQFQDPSMDQTGGGGGGGGFIP